MGRNSSAAKVKEQQCDRIHLRVLPCTGGEGISARPGRGHTRRANAQRPCAYVTKPENEISCQPPPAAPPVRAVGCMWCGEGSAATATL